MAEFSVQCLTSLISRYWLGLQFSLGAWSPLLSLPVASCRTEVPIFLLAVSQRQLSGLPEARLRFLSHGALSQSSE